MGDPNADQTADADDSANDDTSIEDDNAKANDTSDVNASMTESSTVPILPCEEAPSDRPAESRDG